MSEELRIHNSSCKHLETLQMVKNGNNIRHRSHQQSCMKTMNNGGGQHRCLNLTAFEMCHGIGNLTCRQLIPLRSLVPTLSPHLRLLTSIGTRATVLRPFKCLFGTTCMKDVGVSRRRQAPAEVSSSLANICLSISWICARHLWRNALLPTSKLKCQL
jgi:hypothetical protein